MSQHGTENSRSWTLAGKRAHDGFKPSRILTVDAAYYAVHGIAGIRTRNIFKELQRFERPALVVLLRLWRVKVILRCRSIATMREEADGRKRKDSLLTKILPRRKTIPCSPKVC